MRKWQWGLLGSLVILGIALFRVGLWHTLQALATSALPQNVLWNNVKELFWPIASTMAVATYMATGRIRRQDLKQRQIDTTGKVLQRYNTVVRKAVLAVMVGFDQRISQADYLALGQAYADDDTLVLYETDLARSCGMAEVLHLLDELQFYLKQENYAMQAELYSAITSEVSRLLLNPKYQPAIDALLIDSTLANVRVLRNDLIERMRRNATTSARL